MLNKNALTICDLHFYFFVLIFAYAWYFVAFCQRLIYEYMDMDMELVYKLQFCNLHLLSYQSLK